MEGNGDLDVKFMIYTNPEATQPIHAIISALFKEKWDTSLEGAALGGVSRVSFISALAHSGWQTELWMRHWLYQRGRTKLYCAELPYPGVCMSDAIYLAGKEGNVRRPVGVCVTVAQWSAALLILAIGCWG